MKRALEKLTQRARIAMGIRLYQTDQPTEEVASSNVSMRMLTKSKNSNIKLKN